MAEPERVGISQISCLYSRSGDSRPRGAEAGGGGTEEREVEIGISDGVNTEITKGLNEDDKVTVRKTEADSRYRNDYSRGSSGMSRMVGGGGSRR